MHRHSKDRELLIGTQGLEYMRSCQRRGMSKKYVPIVSIYFLLYFIDKDSNVAVSQDPLILVNSHYTEIACDKDQ